MFLQFYTYTKHFNFWSNIFQVIRKGEEKVKISSQVADDKAHEYYSFYCFSRQKAQKSEFLNQIGALNYPEAPIPRRAVRGSITYLVHFKIQSSFVKWMLEFHVHLVLIKTCGHDLKLLKNGMLLTNLTFNKNNHSFFVFYCIQLFSKIIDSGVGIQHLLGFLH